MGISYSRGFTTDLRDLDYNDPKQVFKIAYKHGVIDTECVWALCNYMLGRHTVDDYKVIEKKYTAIARRHQQALDNTDNYRLSVDEVKSDVFYFTDALLHHIVCVVDGLL